MITTRRQNEYNVATEGVGMRSSSVDLLERKVPANTNAYASAAVKEESYEEAKERMQKNLDKLLNYDRYAEVSESTELLTEDVQVERAQNEDDIRPSSTTMQFGNDNIENIYQDINRQKEVQNESRHLSKKSKFVVMLYALTVAVIFALIVLNTGVLSRLSRQSEASAATLNSRVAQLDAINEEIDSISSAEHIIDVAENEYGMIIK